jgi:hypothetical protein
MPGGHASHKGASAKPNVNTNGLTNAAAEGPQDTQGVISNADDSTRIDEAEVNPAAVERPQTPDDEK